MYSQATPGLLKACVTVCDEIASRQLSVSRSLTILISIHLVLKTKLVHGRHRCASRYIFSV